jgi:hypothetical protein
MNVPRPLLVVVVVIIILGVVSCGVGVIRGRMDAARPAPTPSVQFEGFGDSAVPARDVRSAGDCGRNGADLTISGTCVLTVDPQSLRPRSLRLLPISGTATVVVTQSIRGETQTSDPDSLSTGESAAKISVAGTSPVNVILSCVTTCQVQIQG